MPDPSCFVKGCCREIQPSIWLYGQQAPRWQSASRSVSLPACRLSLHLSPLIHWSRFHAGSRFLSRQTSALNTQHFSQNISFNLSGVKQWKRKDRKSRRYLSKCFNEGHDNGATKCTPGARCTCLKLETVLKKREIRSVAEFAPNKLCNSLLETFLKVVFTSKFKTAQSFS